MKRQKKKLQGPCHKINDVRQYIYLYMHVNSIYEDYLFHYSLHFSSFLSYGDTVWDLVEKVPI